MTAASTSARAAVDACRLITAPGSDPELVVRAVAALLQMSPGTLVRRALEAGSDQLTSRLPQRLGAETSERVAAVAMRWHQHDARVALVGDPGYPRRLATGWPHTGGPPLLAWRGPDAAAWPDIPTVGVVGARRATSYGSGVAAWLAEAAVDAGAGIVSGGAVGIDAAAHRAGIGRTIVVLGCGHAVRYPAAHARSGGLFDEVLAAGGTLCSEHLPERPVSQHTVRARNRIVAALADVVVVVEGGERSGALLTAAAAAERGVPVLAVPGDVRAPGSAAPHRLLAEGAAPCRGPDDLLDALGSLRLRAVTPQTSDRGAAGPSCLPEPVRRELEERWPRPLQLAELLEASGMSTGPVLAALTRAQVAGEVVDGPDGVRLRRGPG